MKKCLFCNSRVRRKDPICFSEKTWRLYCMKCAPKDGKEKISMYHDPAMNVRTFKMKLLLVFITLFIVPPVSIYAVSFSTSVIMSIIIAIPFLAIQCVLWIKILD